MTQKRNRQHTAGGFVAGAGTLYAAQRYRARSVRKPGVIRPVVGNWMERQAVNLAAQIRKRHPVPVPKTRFGRAVQYGKKSRLGRWALNKAVAGGQRGVTRVLGSRTLRRFLIEMM